MRITRSRVIAGLLGAAVVTSGILFGLSATTTAHADRSAQTTGMPRYNHVFYIMMENRAYNEIIGNSYAPHINALANQYGLATNYFGVTHDSEPNYVASVGGSYFSVTNTSSPSNTDDSSDNAYYCSPTSTLPECASTSGNHQIDGSSLFSQLEEAGKSWKTYEQSIPSPGFRGLTWPARVVPGATDALYAAKHNPILNFMAYYGPAPTSPSWTPNAAQLAELNKVVGTDQLTIDLQSGNVPAFSYIVPNQCNDMHGTHSCPFDYVYQSSEDDALVTAGDNYINSLVNEIQSSKVWRQGNNAIVITWDENDYSPLGNHCSVSAVVASNGCQVATIVMANHGPHHVTYNVPANHYSLMLTIEQAFGLPCLNQTCQDSGSNVQPMTPLFSVAGEGAR